jgi:hypothetical protein
LVGWLWRGRISHAQAGAVDRRLSDAFITSHAAGRLEITAD